ncbi:hypothetical protein PV378_42640, partial [Streptomyces scabiei]
PSSPGGDVIHLSGRRGPRPSGPVAPIGGNAAYEPHPEPALPGSDPLNELALTVEALFRSQQRTLTNEATAGDYGITLTAVELMMQGALARGIITADSHIQIHGMLEGMRAAAQLVTPD